MDEDIREIAARLDADRREAAEQMTFGERLLAGAAMFDINVMMMRTGIRLDLPDADEATVQRILLDRLRHARGDEMTA